MTIDPQNAGGAAAGIVERVKNILLTPQAEWDRIAAEPTDLNKLYVGYALPLVGAASLAMLLGIMLASGSVQLALMQAILLAISVGVSMFVMGFVANALAPTFGSVQDPIQAHKLPVYGFTASLVACLLLIIPFVGMLAVLGGIYSLVLLWIGLPRLMKTPEDKRVGYYAALVVICIVVGAVLNSVLTRLFFPGYGAWGY